MNGTPAVEAGGVDPALDVVGRPVRAVHDHVGLFDHGARVRHALDAPLERHHLALRVEGAERLGRRVDLDPADVALAVQDLPVEVALLDTVVVHHHQLADAAAHERV